MGWWKKLAFSIVAVALFFALIECALWVSGVQNLVTARDPYQGFSETGRIFERDDAHGVYRTAPRATRHSFNIQTFRIEKPKNGFRVFVLGGSSAYGFPWGASVAFARVLGDALQKTYPDRAIEVINAAGMSYGFHRLRILTREVLQYDPDVLVYYEAHNEFTERNLLRRVLGQTMVLGPVQALLYSSRIYSLMTQLVEKLRPRPARDPRSGEGKTVGELLGVDVVREDMAQTLDDEKRQTAVRLEGHLDAIMDMAGRRPVKVVFCTVASNLRDWTPHQSFFAPDVPADRRDAALRLLAQGRAALDAGSAADAVAALAKARDLAPGYADIHFRLGRAYEALQRWDDARAAYVRARDADAQPVRAISLMEDTIRRFAARRGLPLADIEKVFEQSAPHGLVGFNLVEDYVHPNVQGHRLIALTLWQLFNREGLLGPPRAADAAEFWRLVGGSPSIAEHAAPSTGEAQANTPAELYNLAYVLDRQGEKDRALALYEQCLALDPRYYAAALNLGQLQLEKGRPDLAARAFQQAHTAEPRRVEALDGLGDALARMGRLREAEAALTRAVELDPKLARSWDQLGMALGLQGRNGEAADKFRRAIAIEPDNYVAQANLGSALLLMGRANEAVAPFRASLAVRHDHAPARNGLAEALARTGALDEAVTLYQASLAANPNDERARRGLAAIQRRRAGAR